MRIREYAHIFTCEQNDYTKIHPAKVYKETYPTTTLQNPSWEDLIERPASIMSLGMEYLTMEIMKRLLVAVLVILFGLTVFTGLAPATDTSASLKTIDDFSDISNWHCDLYTNAVVVNSCEFESFNAAKVTYNYHDGIDWADFCRAWSQPQDWRYRQLTIDIYPLNSTLYWTSSPTIKINSSSGKVIIENRYRVTLNQWNTITIDLTQLNQSDLSDVVELDLYIADSINPGSVTFYIDNLKLINESPPKVSDSTELILSVNSTWEDQWYSELHSDSPGINVSFRVTEGAEQMDRLDSKGYYYYYTSASSDYPRYCGLPLYKNLSEVVSALDRLHCKGLYMHEVLTYHTDKETTHWNWPDAVDRDLNWSWINETVQATRQKGGKVLWSEPSYAWKFIYQYYNTSYWFNQWNDTVVPIWATNFVNHFDQWWAARDYSYATAGHYQLSWGESIQSWYFHDYLVKTPEQYSNRSVFYDTTPIPVNRETTEWLGAFSWDHGARYFQIEGDLTDMEWNSTYMLGIRDFRNYIEIKQTSTTPKCAMKTKTDGFFYIPYMNVTALRIELLFENAALEGDQKGGPIPYPNITEWPHGEVDVVDVYFVGSHYGQQEGWAKWDYMADIVADRKCDVKDYYRVQQNSGKPLGNYSISLTDITVQFDTRQTLTPDTYGYVTVPSSATNFTIRRNENTIGALVTFY